MTKIEDVKNFWETQPLFSGESVHPVGSKAYFDEHRDVVIADCFAGRFDSRFLPPEENREHVLDLGCGPGFWIIELLTRRAADRLTGADLTVQALRLACDRLAIYGETAELVVQNAEDLTFEDATFSHVNCQGVVHHTPNTQAAVAEIARVLRPGGTASLSVYYKNFFVRNFAALSGLYRMASKAGAELRGRGRESIYSAPTAEEVVRMFDGAENPIGKGYTRHEWEEMLRPHFKIDEIFYHFFPVRSLPVSVPGPLHRILDRTVPFMIYANVTKLRA
jgi:ubiquinone/menaquinone biosynthesis C-methylase UbiE